jgi:hypothetical protein
LASWFAIGSGLVSTTSGALGWELHADRINAQASRGRGLFIAVRRMREEGDDVKRSVRLARESPA